MALPTPLQCPHASKQLRLLPRQRVHRKSCLLSTFTSLLLMQLWHHAVVCSASTCTAVYLHHTQTAASCLGTEALPCACSATGRQHPRQEATSSQQQPAHDCSPAAAAASLAHKNRGNCKVVAASIQRLTSSGHSPASTRKRELLPLPLGPMIITDSPRLTWKVRSRTRGVPSGAFSATLHQP